MKSNKGFTLIELLAVIVILAIIALIATPIILNVIDTARKGAKESSALGYIDAVEKQVMLAQVDATATKINAGTYSVQELATAGVEIKGETPKSNGVVTIDTKGAVTKAWLEYDAYKVYYNLSDGKAVASTEKFIDKDGHDAPNKDQLSSAGGSNSGSGESGSGESGSGESGSGETPANP